MLATVVVELAARPARTRVGHAPEVVVVALVSVAPTRHARLRHADLVAPDVPRLVVVRIRGDADALERDLVDLSQQLDRPLDRFALEVVAEAPIAEHLEEGVVARRTADLLEVIVFAGHAQAALHVHGARVRPFVDAGQHVLERDHARVHEEQRLVAGRDQRSARHDRVSTLGEEVDETLPDLRGGHARKVRALFAEVVFWHRLRVGETHFSGSATALVCSYTRPWAGMSPPDRSQRSTGGRTRPASLFATLGVDPNGVSDEVKAERRYEPWISTTDAAFERSQRWDPTSPSQTSTTPEPGTGRPARKADRI